MRFKEVFEAVKENNGLTYTRMDRMNDSVFYTVGICEGRITIYWFKREADGPKLIKHLDLDKTEPGFFYSMFDPWDWDRTKDIWILIPVNPKAHEILFRRFDRPNEILFRCFDRIT